jgi:hypothetical protein
LSRNIRNFYFPDGFYQVLFFSKQTEHSKDTHTHTYKSTL